MAGMSGPIRTEVITKDGECKLNIQLEITVNVNTNGGVSVDAVAQQVKRIEKPKEEENFEFAIPDFGSENINFGKKE